MIKRALKHFGLLGLILGTALSFAPTPAQAQDRYWGRGNSYGRQWNGYDRGYGRDSERQAWRRGREFQRERDWRRDAWRREAWRRNRWDRRSYRGYNPGPSFYFGYRY